MRKSSVGGYMHERVEREREKLLECKKKSNFEFMSQALFSLPLTLFWFPIHFPTHFRFSTLSLAPTFAATLSRKKPLFLPHSTEHTHTYTPISYSSLFKPYHLR